MGLHTPALQPLATFASALDEHLAALQARDITRFAATLVHRDDVQTVGPDGRVTQGFEAVVDAHAAWFADSADWRFTARERWRHVTSDTGLVLLEVDYRHAPEAEAIRFLLLLAFVCENGSWRMLFDQNTPLKPPLT